jgi:dTDP-4-amino-4,6-dideoxygalactose transaminase
LGVAGVQKRANRKINKNAGYCKQCRSADERQVSGFFAEKALWLPNGPGIKKEDIERVCQKIREFYNGL